MTLYMQANKPPSVFQKDTMSKGVLLLTIKMLVGLVLCEGSTTK